MVRISGLAVAVVLIGVALAWTYLGMRAVMDIGGACATGGPYVPAQACPEGATTLLSVGIPLLLLATFAASGIALMLGLGLTAPVTAGAVEANPQVCSGLDSGKIDLGGNKTTYVVHAPEGMLITGYCVKAGSAKQGLTALKDSGIGSGAIAPVETIACCSPLTASPLTSASLTAQ